eukprot:2787937-Amphidinium_carterae.1
MLVVFLPNWRVLWTLARTSRRCKKWAFPRREFLVSSDLLSLFVIACLLVLAQSVSGTPWAS